MRALAGVLALARVQEAIQEHLKAFGLVAVAASAAGAQLVWGYRFASRAWVGSWAQVLHV